MSPYRFRIARVLAPLGLALLLGAACARPTPGPPPADWLPELENWRASREAALKRPNGWLSLVGLWWLEPGETPFGSDPSLPIALPPGAAPERAGTFRLDEGRVRLVVDPAAGVTLNGAAAESGVELNTDREGKPDVIQAGRIALTVIQRGEKIGLRGRDPESPALAAFHGVSWFPPDPAWRLEARFERAAAPREIPIPSAGGVEQRMWALGTVRFTIDGREHTLVPLGGDPGDEELFIVFRDETTGEETYGAGRFLDAGKPGPDGSVVLDFNAAYNPPCAFTPFATCPLPPKQNALGVAVRAGERKYGDGH